MELLQIDIKGLDSNFSYILMGKNNEGVIIDPTGDLEKILSVIKEKNVKLLVQLLTHGHPDHIENVDYFLEQGVPLKKFEDFEKNPEFELAGIKFKTYFTPGHTSDSVCFLVENNLITGDTLFVRGVGTTAYGGNDLELKDSLDFLHTLNGDLKIWPGHNYGGESAHLKIALSNSTIKPDDKTLENIKKRVSEYEKNN
jgi:glyoxylase-like metal-dependent hydrolase (beta-lactamase superfamily II)